MRTAALLLALALAPALAADAAAADGEVSVEAGDRVTGDVGPGDTDRIRFPGMAGARLSARLAGAGPSPRLVVESPDGADLREGDRSGRLRRVLLASSGRYTLRVEGRGPGPASYALETSLRLPRTLRVRGGKGEDEAILSLGSVPAGTTLGLRAPGGEVESVIDALGEIPLSSARAVTVQVRASGPVTVEVHLRRRGRPGVRARVRAAERVPVEREVLDGAPPGGGGGGGGGGDDDPRVPGLVAVRLRDGAGDDDVADRHGGRSLGFVEGTAFALLEVPEGVDDDDFLDGLGEDDDCVEKEPLYVSDSPEGGQSNLAFTSSEAARQDVVDQQAFVLTGVGTAQGVAGGAGVVVAILDTGVDASHPDLAGRLLPGFDLVDGDGDPSDAPNGLDDDGDLLVDEGVGHGTFVAGLVAAIAPEANILPVRVLDSDARGSTARVAEGIVRAVDARAKVVNLSLGLRRNSALLQDALSYAKKREVLVVAAAGNRASASAVDFPASLSEVLAVSAVDGAGVRPGFANASSKVDVVAPGVDLLAPFAAAGGAPYARWSGTSFAAPFASAGAALVLSHRPGLRPRDAGRALEDSAVPVDAANPGLAGSLGRGRISLPAALQEE